jgi:hypothetical protein
MVPPDDIIDSIVAHASVGVHTGAGAEDIKNRMQKYSQGRKIMSESLSLSLTLLKRHYRYEDAQIKTLKGRKTPKYQNIKTLTSDHHYVTRT